MMAGEIVKREAETLPAIAREDWGDSAIPATYDRNGLNVGPDDIAVLADFEECARGADLTQKQFRGAVYFAINRLPNFESWDDAWIAFVDGCIIDGWQDTQILAIGEWLTGLRDGRLGKPDPKRKSEIEKIMRSEPQRYWKDASMQAEYLALTEAEG